MSISITDSRYYLRSRSDKHNKHPPSPPISPSPTTPPMDIIPNPTTTTTTTTTITNTRKLRPRRKKRRFSQLTSNGHTNATSNEDIDLNVTTNNSNSNSKSSKKMKLSRTIKFTLNLHPVTTREISLPESSPVISRKRKRIIRIENFEIPLSYGRSNRNPYICQYSFFNGFIIGIKPTLGNANDLKDAIKILSQELVSGRAKASIQTQKNAYLIYIKTRKNKLIGCGILHIDHVWKRVNIEMFAVDISWRGNGFASLMVYLIQYRMIHYNKYDLFVCAANDAVPFWCNKKYNFVLAHKGILEQHEVDDERHANTKHLIWYGNSIQARCALLKCFTQAE